MRSLFVLFALAGRTAAMLEVAILCAVECAQCQQGNYLKRYLTAKEWGYLQSGRLRIVVYTILVNYVDSFEARAFDWLFWDGDLGLYGWFSPELHFGSVLRTLSTFIWELRCDGCHGNENVKTQ